MQNSSENFLKNFLKSLFQVSNLNKILELKNSLIFLVQKKSLRIPYFSIFFQEIDTLYIYPHSCNINLSLSFFFSEEENCNAIFWRSLLERDIITRGTILIFIASNFWINFTWHHSIWIFRFNFAPYASKLK